jgi:hypothetical protein
MWQSVARKDGVVCGAFYRSGEAVDGRGEGHRQWSFKVLVSKVKQGKGRWGDVVLMREKEAARTTLRLGSIRVREGGRMGGCGLGI